VTLLHAAAFKRHNSAWRWLETTQKILLLWMLGLYGAHLCGWVFQRVWRWLSSTGTLWWASSARPGCVMTRPSSAWAQVMHFIILQYVHNHIPSHIISHFTYISLHNWIHYITPYQNTLYHSITRRSIHVNHTITGHNISLHISTQYITPYQDTLYHSIPGHTISLHSRTNYITPYQDILYHSIPEHTISLHTWTHYITPYQDTLYHSKPGHTISLNTRTHYITQYQDTLYHSIPWHTVLLHT